MGALPMNSAGKDVSDPALVAACLRGDGRAWRRLVDRHGPLVWAVARRSGLSDSDAAEVFQNTWTIALEDLSALRKPSRVAAWLGRIAQHQALRTRRGYAIARNAHPHVAREDVSHELPADELERLETRGRVGRALARLGGRCKELLEALYMEPTRPSYDDLAERFDMSVGSIGPTRGRCLEKLKHLFPESLHG